MLPAAAVSGSIDVRTLRSASWDVALDVSAELVGRLNSNNIRTLAVATEASAATATRPSQMPGWTNVLAARAVLA